MDIAVALFVDELDVYFGLVVLLFEMNQDRGCKLKFVSVVTT